MKKTISILVLALIIPQIAFASWWNPFSWKIWNMFNGNDAETQILEDRIKDLEDKLSEVSTSTAETESIVPEKKVNTTSTNKIQDKTLNAVQPSTNNISIPPITYDGIVKKYTDFQALVTEEKSHVKKNSELETEKTYYKYLDELLNKINADLGYLGQIKYVNPRPNGIVELYVSKFNQLNDEYLVKHKNYGPNREADELQTAKRNIISYIKENKYILYLSANHITAAALFDMYDELFNTQYSEKFKLTVTQQETVEFANSFLIDLGESPLD